jgi:hypothetical protein
MCFLRAEMLPPKEVPEQTVISIKKAQKGRMRVEDITLTMEC